MIIDTVEYRIGDELEDLQLWWEHTSGGLVNFDDEPSTFSATVRPEHGPALLAQPSGFPKTSGFSQGEGDGTKADGTPNLTVAWSTTGELNAIATPGDYLLVIEATRVGDSGRRTAFVRLRMGC